MKEYDILVIGSGMAGMTIAQKCAAKGKRVAITDSQPYGGTCALRGCDPKKVLLGVAEIVEHARRLSGKGLLGNLSIQWQDLMKFKETFTEPVPESIEKNYQKMGIDTFHAPVKFIAETTLQIGEAQVHAENIVVATGAMPKMLNIPGEEYTLTSTEFLSLSELPEEITFIGGGYIAFEFEGHVVASNLLRGNTKTADYTEMPTVVFTIPAMASVGLTETQAKQQGKNYTVKMNIVPTWYNARRLNEEVYAFKTLVDEASGMLLGAHLVGPQAEEIINLFAMAIKARMPFKDLKSMVYAYPTFASDISHMV